jgi:hypothetical protein
MRPKIVILVLMAAIGVVALAAVLKGVMGGHDRQEANGAPEPPPAEPGPTAVRPPVGPNSSNTAAVLDQLRAAEIAKELDQIRELQAEGADSPTVTGLLLGKVTHREPEVRTAARDALVQLGDTNAISGLEQALGHIEDPREKTAVMEAIEYLKLPDAMAAEPPPAGANSGRDNTPAARAKRAGQKNPKGQPGRKPGWRPPAPAAGAAAQPAAPANPYPAQPQTQPESPAPETAPPADNPVPQ